MFKICGIVLIIIFSFLVGYYFSLRLKNRLEFLSGFREFMTALETNIRYNSGDIFTVIKKSLPKKTAEYFKSDNFNSLSEYWESCVTNISNSTALKREDLSLLREFGRMLGTTDIEGQLNHIELYKELINSNINNSIEELKKKGKLFKLLGLFAGIAAALMII